MAPDTMPNGKKPDETGRSGLPADEAAGARASDIEPRGEHATVSDMLAEQEAASEKKERVRKPGRIFKPRDKRPNFVLSVILTAIKIMFVVVLVAIVAGFGSVIGVANAYLETTPELDTRKIEDQNLSSYIYDQEGNLLATYTGRENRDWAYLENIPQDLRNAFIAVEDTRFYDHNGVDFRRLVGAFASNLSSSKVEGGSTITQQLIKNKLLTNERSYKRKLQEAYLAMQLENKYTKDEILEWYLNTIPLGGTVYGVKTAASDYFGKSLDQLSLKEMVCIAAITQSTTRFNPRRATYSFPENLPYLVDRMNIITERMLWADMITQEQYDQTYIPAEQYLDPASYTDENGEKHLVLKDGFLESWTAEMSILPESPANTLYKYPHFVEYVIEQCQTFMLRKQGLEDTEENRNAVELQMRQGGYKIYATIDPAIQETVQTTFATWEDFPRFKRGVETVVQSTDAEGHPVEIVQPQCAAVVVDNRADQGYDGFIRAIVGAREEPTQALTFNRAYMGSMQIGSSIKPMAVYGPAFNEGYGLASSVANIREPITGWTVTDRDPGYPQTSMGTEGPMSLRTAIVKSLNISAARVLADYVGLDKSESYLLKLGVDPEHIDKTLVGLALGASPITPMEVAGGYATIARGGEYVEPISFTRVEDNEGNVVIDAVAERKRNEAFSKATCWELVDALSDAVDHGTGTNAKISGMTTAGKTGTVVDNKGTFFAGFTPYYTSSLWIGHDRFQPFASGSGGGVAAPLWRTYMTAIHEGLEDKPILDYGPEDAGLVQVTLCEISNMLPRSGCSTNTDWIAAEFVPTQRCESHSYWNGGRDTNEVSGYWVCSETGLRSAGYCPSTRFVELEEGDQVPEGYCPIHVAPRVTETQAPAGPTSTTTSGNLTPITPTQAPPQPTRQPVQPTQAPPQPTQAPPQPTQAPPQPTQAPPEPTPDEPSYEPEPSEDTSSEPAPPLE